jgi:hypothetical protein
MNESPGAIRGTFSFLDFQRNPRVFGSVLAEKSFGKLHLSAKSQRNRGLEKKLNLLNAVDIGLSPCIRSFMKSNHFKPT